MGEFGDVPRDDPRGARPELVARGRRLFQFLAAAQRLRLKPVRTTDTYADGGAVFWLGELPEHPAVATAAQDRSPALDTPLLAVQRVAAQDPPAPPASVEPWLDGTCTDPEQAPVLRSDRTVVTADVPDGQTLQRDDHPDVESAHQVWRADWDVWARQELIDRPVRGLYKELFSAFSASTNQPEELELVLGVGCLAWAPLDHDRVRRHTLVTPAVIDFDESTGALTVRAEPALDSLTVELDMLDPARSPAPNLRQDVVERARVQEAHPLDRAATGDLLRRLVNSLDPDGRFDDTDSRPQVGAVPVLAFAPAIVLRRRSQLGLVAVFEQIEAAIAQAGEVPSGLLPLLDPDHVPDAEPDRTPGAMVDLDDGEVFLPLPLNDRQLDIIQRVDRQAQTLVQGPPGTGKTHLAAALISHLLAQGKRVLVTAHTDRALKEVRGKLPEEIKPLAVSVVGSDRSDMADLKVAVERISGKSNDGDPVALQDVSRAEADDALGRIDRLRRRRAELRTRLVDARAEDVAERSYAGYSGTLASIARIYHDEADSYDWLVNYVRPVVDSRSPISGDDAARWLGLLRDTDVTRDESEASRKVPDLTTMPAPEGFSELLDQWTASQSHYAEVEAWAQHPAFQAVSSLDASLRSQLQERLTEISRQISGFENRDEQWMVGALRDLRTGRRATWTGRSDHVKSLLDLSWAALQRLGPAPRVQVLEGADRSAVESLARYLLAHVRVNGPAKVNPDGSVKIGTFAAKALKNSKLLFDAVRVDGRQPATEEQLTTLLDHLDVQRHIDALDTAWPADVLVPREDTLHERFQWHATEWQQLQGLLAVGQELAAEQQRFDTLGIPHPDWNDLTAVHAYARLVDAAAAKDAQAAAAIPLRRLLETAVASAAQDEAAQVCAMLEEAVRRADRSAYARAHERLRWLQAIRGKLAERNTLTAQVARVAPALAEAVTSSPNDDLWTTRLPALERAWDRARVGLWVLAQDTEDANELQQQLDVAEGAIRGEIERLAGVRAWRHALSPSRLTGQSRADLNLYVRLVKRLGKGTGKYAPAQRAEIRQAMDRCRPAVPVWIMPIYRIAEQLRVTENMFDVVIVDEASQAGLEATFLQYLAPKIVVIGDDKQVSPSAVGVDQQQLRDLAAQFLGDHRYKASWQDPKMSLFDAASIWYGSRRTLVEHRRCVPEIIGFSNRIAYEPENIKLIPVRQFGADRLEPVKAIHVTDGHETGGSGTKVNRPEAEAIVAQIEKCIVDPRYDRKTIGVVSLLGPRQAKVINDLLLERVPPEEWASRELRCGDAAAFQGSERDVMFLSMVSAPEPGQRMGALTLEANVQRYNVAASRAKDQMWVFHSVTLGQLTNPEDMRFQLLDYCYHGVRTARVDDSGAVVGLVSEDARVEPFDSLFEQRVHNRLVERGYTVVPQFDSMGYRIDLVVVGGKGRLAVECDGDFWHGPEHYLRDLARERDLRRCGWEFFRIRESAFYVDQNSILTKLWSTLDELEIRPAGWSDDVEGDDAPDDVAEAPDAAEPSVLVTAHIDDDTEPGWEADQHEEPIDEGAVIDLPGADEDVDDTAYFRRTSARTVLRAPRPAPRLSEPDNPRTPAMAAQRTQPLSSGALLPYVAFDGVAPPAQEASTAELDQVLRDIVDVEGPVMGFRIQAAYVKASGGQRVGKAIAVTLNRALSSLIRRGIFSADDPLGRAGVRPRTFRLPGQALVVVRELGPRDLEHVPPSELAELLRSSAAVTGWGNADALYREVLRRLGRLRLTSGVQQTLDSVWPIAHAEEDPGDSEGAG